MPVLMQAFVEKKPDEEKLRKKKKPPQEAETPEPPKEIYLSQPHFEKGRYRFNLAEIERKKYHSILKKMDMDESDFIALEQEMDKVFELAKTGAIDLSDVIMEKMENGMLRLVMNEEEKDNIRLNKDAYNEIEILIFQEAGIDMSDWISGKADKKGLLDATIRVLLKMSKYEKDTKYIKTPQQFANQMLEWVDGGKEEYDMPRGNCVDYALLANEILGGLKFVSSIIKIMPVNEYGGKDDGHATAAIVADNYIIDPAAFGKHQEVERIMLNVRDAEYEKFHGEMIDKYKEYFPDAEMFEFQNCKTENEIKSVFYLENGVRKPLTSRMQAEDILRANELDDANIYAAELAGFMYKVMGDEAKTDEKKKEMCKKSFEIYLKMIESNPDSYLANIYATRGFYNIYIKEKSVFPIEAKKFLEGVYEKYAKKAFRMNDSKFSEDWIYTIAGILGKTEDAKSFIRRLRKAE
ncbi:MAG: hypothetical protein ABIH83_04420 [Candidatus Micrarchaeota archaeon]